MGAFYKERIDILRELGYSSPLRRAAGLNRIVACFFPFSYRNTTRERTELHVTTPGVVTSNLSCEGIYGKEKSFL
jgi:hypothetical protein